MRTRRYLFLFPVFLLAAFAAFPMPAQSSEQAGQAARVVRDFHDTLLNVMKGAKQTSVQARYETLAPAVDRAFHLNLTARQAAGRRAWKGATEADKSALSDVFRRWTIATYASQFDGWSGQTFVDHGETQGPRKGTILVKTELTGEEPVTLTYLMVLKDGRWGVYDVLVRQGTTSISQLAKHISEFRGITRNGLSALTATLEQKTKVLLAP